MTRRPPEELLRELGRMPIPVEDPDAKSERRERIVRGIAMAVRKQKERSRGRRIRQRFAWIAAAALVLLAVGAGIRSRPVPAPAVASLRSSGAPVMVSHAGKTEVATGESSRDLAVGDGVSTLADSHADLRLQSGVEVGVRSSTRVAIEKADAQHEVLALSLGEISVRVPPLGPDRSFAVWTPDAKVLVHGTAFIVRVKRAGGGMLTEVEVSEGKVSVSRGEDARMLSAGEVWPERVEPETKLTPSVTPAPTSVESGPKLAAKPPSPNALADQNRLFAAAARARRQGDDRAAVAALTQLITRYPDSVLVPEARVERFRALKRLGRDAEAAREAKKYLLEQKDGAARDEARGVVLEPKP
jgi:hypothetical protein